MYVNFKNSHILKLCPSHLIREPMVSNIAIWHVHILAKGFEFVNETLFWKTFKIKLQWPTYKFIKFTGNHFDRICVYQRQRLQRHDLLQWGASVWILSLTQQKVLLNNIRGINMEYRALLLELLFLVECCRQVWCLLYIYMQLYCICTKYIGLVLYQYQYQMSPGHFRIQGRFRGLNTCATPRERNTCSCHFRYENCLLP